MTVPATAIACRCENPMADADGDCFRCGRTVQPSTRPLREERARQVKALRDEGLIYREIAERLGISLSYAAELGVDPEGASVFARKHKLSCVDCGRPITSDNPGKGGPHLRCAGCAARRSHDERHWTRETIIDAMHRWMEETGEQPRATDWNRTMSSPEMRALYVTGDYPPTSTVAREFGTFGAGLVAAGYTPKWPHACKPRNSVSAEDTAKANAMRAGGASWQDVADAFGISRPAAIQRWKRSHDMPSTLSAATVIEREIARFEARAAQAAAEATSASEQAERLRSALAILQNGNGKAA